MKQYLDCLKYILENGVKRQDRTGVGTIGVFCYQMRFNLKDGFPAVTTKKLAWKALTSELLWFLEGSTNERRLCEILHGTTDYTKKTIWTENYNQQGQNLGYANGELGPIYGENWRRWATYEFSAGDFAEDGEFQNASGYVEYKDQIATIIHDLKTDPYSRRHVLSAWNVGTMDKASLPACHTMAQFYVQGNTLNCSLMQRSGDIFLGIPFNIASYSLLTHMIAQVCNLEVGEFVHTINDAHIYKNHIEQVKEQLTRTPMVLPTLGIDKTITNIDDFNMNSFWLENYNPMPTIKADMAV